MSVVKMGLAGQENVTITMFNTKDEDVMLGQSDAKDMTGAKYGMARKRLFNDKYLKTGKDGKPIYISHCSESVVFPISV